MKLRNKNTGEIIDDGYVRETYDFQFDGQKHVLAVFKGNGHRPPERVSGAYTSLAELNEEWEDYEGPKTFWAISWAGEPEEYDAKNTPEELKNMAKQIGNYFSSREEAEKAVEKLKAWERLQKKFNFHITGWDVVDTQVIITTDCDFDYVKDRQDDGLWSDLDLVFNGNLLFGGEE